MKKLPIGIQSFDKIRSADFYYVDKTRYVHELTQKGQYYFMSRPRRFGKSLFLDTLSQAFTGKKEYFTGLFLEHHWDWDVCYPVINLSFGTGVIKKTADLETIIISLMDEIAQNYDVKIDGELLILRFRELIIKLYNQHQRQVVILIDEYDKPILDNIENPDLARDIREGLKNFYSVIKDCDRYLKFVFITGISKFSKVSLFS
ncbi:MAG: AAA family ATPase, partial [Deltaproteobacteria bacterium]